jgi:H+/gluconate symporter-like permease
LNVASLVGFGSIVAALPAFAMVRDWVLGIEGGPLVSLAVATNVLAALTGSASGGPTIALDSLGGAYMKIAAEQGIDPGLMHRVAVIGAARSTCCRTMAPSSLFWPFAARPTAKAISTSS